MSVRVRLFAAAREAAGTGETTVEAVTVSGALAQLEERYGERFRASLAVATVLVDGDALARGEDRPLAAGAELAILPPVSGGAVPGDAPAGGAVRHRPAAPL